MPFLISVPAAWTDILGNMEPRFVLIVYVCDDLLLLIASLAIFSSEL